MVVPSDSASPFGGNLKEDAVVDLFGLVPLFLIRGSLYAAHLHGEPMHVLSFSESLYQLRVLRHVRQEPHLELLVVGFQQHVAGGRDHERAYIFFVHVSARQDEKRKFCRWRS